MLLRGTRDVATALCQLAGLAAQTGAAGLLVGPWSTRRAEDVAAAAMVGIVSSRLVTVPDRDDERRALPEAVRARLPLRGRQPPPCRSPSVTSGAVASVVSRING